MLNNTKYQLKNLFYLEDQNKCERFASFINNENEI